jgi:hypothetical protein
MLTSLLSIFSSVAIVFMVFVSLRSYHHFKRGHRREEERAEEIHQHNMAMAKLEGQMRLTQLKIVEAELVKARGTVGFTQDHGEGHA